MNKILVLNAGSSSIKYQLLNMQNASVLTSGLVERIGESSSRLKYKWTSSNSAIEEEATIEQPIADHREGLGLVLDLMQKIGVISDLKEISGIGHRVVHGGEIFWKPTLINDEVIKSIGEMTPLAPLHNPANLMGIEVSRKLCPTVPQVAVFDTAFHQTLPPAAYHYAIPKKYYTDLKIRRYGFHGTSHYFVAKLAAQQIGKPLSACSFITVHLGNGASISAIKEGKCIDTSMGMTPLEGLVMGTRSGDLDPAIPFYLARMTGKSFDDVEKILNKESGLKGICGANDMREIEGLALEGNAEAQLALDIFCRRIKKYIGSYAALLENLDAVIFTGGIGENSSTVRKLSCEKLGHIGIPLDLEKNNSASRALREISPEGSRVRILVIPTNEELEIAKQTVECMK